MDADIDLFVRNFKELWKSGRSAHLNLDTHAGEAWIGLRVRLGHTGQHHHRHEPERKTRNSPSRQRRRLRRAAAREKVVEEAVYGTEVAEKAATDATNNEDYGCTTEVAEEVTDNVVEVETEFLCDLCDFKSKWQNGINIHMARKHSKIEQLDGNNSVSDASEEDDEKYNCVKHYLNKGWLGGAYQTYLDAIDVIDESDLQEEVKVVEKRKVLEARKLALGDNFSWFPPWDSSSPPSWSQL